MRPTLHTLLALVLCAAITLTSPSCAPRSPWADVPGSGAIQPSALPGTGEFPEAGAIVVLDEGSMEVLSGREIPMSIFERHRVVKVLTRAGQRFANVMIAYAPGSEVEGIEARTIAPDGSIAEVRSEDIYDTSIYPSFIFFSDQRVKMFTMPAVRDGCVLEYRYRIRFSSRTLWPSWNFQDQVPTLVSRFSLVTPSEWKIVSKLYGIAIAPQVKHAPHGFRSVCTWEARHLPALQPEFGMPPEREIAARLVLVPAGMKGWQDVARWFHELASPRMNAGAPVRGLASMATRGLSDDREKLRRLYEWVRDRVRYIAVEVGMGGYQPHAVDEVCTREYGDCKDMATLLCALSREAGIRVRPALISTWQNGLPDTALPSPLQFNHMIACYEGPHDTLWMDATEKGAPFGQLPWYDAGLPALVIAEDGRGEMQWTPRSHAADNLATTEWHAALALSGSAAVKGSMTFSGNAAVDLRSGLSEAPPADRRAWLESILAQQCSGAVLDSFSISGLHDPRDPLVIGYNFSSRTFARPRGSSLVLRPGLISGSSLPDHFRSVRRMYPLRFHYGIASEMTLRISLPTRWPGAEPNQVSDTLASAFGVARWAWTVTDSGLTFQASHLLTGEEVAPSEYLLFREFLDAMRERDLCEVILIPRVQRPVRLEGSF